MKCFALLICLTLFADNSTANEYRSEDRVYPALLLNTIKAGFGCMKAPAIENGDRIGAWYARNFVNESLFYIQSLMILQYEQGFRAGDRLIEAVENRADELQKAIDSINPDEKCSTCLDDASKAFIDQLQEFLDLNPGKAIIKQPCFRKLPEQQIEVQSRTTDRSASDLFLHLGEGLEHDFSTLYGFIQQLYLTGWKAGRTQFDTLQMQLRDQVLNGPVMKAYKHAVDRFLRQLCVIENHVKKETWESFREIADRIIHVYYDYNKPKIIKKKL